MREIKNLREIYFLLLTSILIYTKAEVFETSLPCRLVWVTLDQAESFYLPSDSVPVEQEGEAGNNNNEYVIRGKFINKPGQYVVGRLVDSKLVLLPHLGKPEDEGSANSTFEILTNPNGCNVEWESNLSPQDKRFEFVVAADGFQNSATDLVGRHWQKSSNSWESGHLKADQKKIYVRTGPGEYDTKTYTNGDFQYLFSYSDGIEMQVIDFEFESDPFESAADFVGMDEVHNQGPGTVTLNIEHKKTIIETYTVRVNKTWTTTKTRKLKILFWTKTKVEIIKTTNITETTTREETEVTVTHQVDVPEYTSIQACSLIHMSQNKVVPYSAVGQYIAPGLTGAEVQKFLKGEGIDTKVGSNGIAQTRIKGTLNAALAMSTEFIIVPFDENLGCTKAAMRARQMRRDANEAPNKN